MDYIKIRFGKDFDRPGIGFDGIGDDVLRPADLMLRPMFRLSERIWKPQMDIYETPEEIFILAEIAGVVKENLEVEISAKAVRIKGNRSEIPRMQHSTYRLAEIQYGKFERILFLPELIDTEKASAAYADGFLNIRLAKLPRDRAHKIPVSDGQT